MSSIDKIRVFSNQGYLEIKALVDLVHFTTQQNDMSLHVAMTRRARLKTKAISSSSVFDALKEFRKTSRTGSRSCSTYGWVYSTSSQAPFLVIFALLRKA